MKYLVCVLFFAGAAVAQWGNPQDDGQWRDDTAHWNSGPNSGAWDGDQGGQWNPAADGSISAQWNPAANQWNAPAPVPQWTAPVQQWGAPGVPQDTPEVAAAKAAHLAVHASHGQRWRRSVIASPLAARLATPWATPLAARLATPWATPLTTSTVWGSHGLVAPIATTVW